MIFGSYIYDVPDLCYVLDKLGIAYEVHDDNLRYFARPNPVVSLTSSLKLIHRCKCPVVFVVDAKAALNKTNVDQTLCRVYTKHQLFQAVKNCVKNKQPLDLQIKEVSLAEIVDKIRRAGIVIFSAPYRRTKQAGAAPWRKKSHFLRKDRIFMTL